MKNIDEILKETGIEVPEDKRAEFDKAFKANYKTVAEMEKQREKLEGERDGYKASADAASEALKSFEGIDPADLQAKLAEAQKAQQELVEKHAKELAARDSRAETERFLSGHKFINDITRQYHVDALETALSDPANKGKNRQDIFSALTQGEDGKPKPGIFADENPNPILDLPPSGPVPPGKMAELSGQVGSLREQAAKLNEHRIIEK